MQVQMTRLLLDPGRATIVQRLDVACKRATFMRARLSIDERQATWSRLDSLRACFDGVGPIRGARRPPQRQLSTHATRQIGQHQDRRRSSTHRFRLSRVLVLAVQVFRSSTSCAQEGGNTGERACHSPGLHLSSWMRPPPWRMGTRRCGRKLCFSLDLALSTWSWMA